MLEEQRHRVSPFTWLALHCNRSSVNSARWLPPGAWQACRSEYTVDPSSASWPAPTASASPASTTLCSERLHGLVVEQRLQHPAHPDLDRAAASAIAKPTPRGWRLVKASENVQVDALVALAVAAERADRPAYATKFLGWE